jgi:adenosylcobinamide-GDP ribazoletransferase
VRDARRLAVGTFLVLPTRPPGRVDRRVAGRAMLLAPLTAIPALLVWAGLALLASRGWLPSGPAAALAVAAPVLLSRGMHLDGLADTADGLSSGMDRDRALEVMHRGDIGPSGVSAIVLVLLVQAACLLGLLSGHTTVLAGVALVASRVAPAIACRRSVPAARRDGLGRTVAGSVSPAGLAAAGGGVAFVGALSCLLSGLPWYAAVLVCLAAYLGAWLVCGHAVRRLGGVTGDVIGAAIEVSLLAGLVAAALLA